MRAIITIIFVLVIAWMLVNYMDNRPAPVVKPIDVELSEAAPTEAEQQSSDRRYYSPQEKAKNTEQVLMDGANKKREQIEAATQ